MDQRHVKGTMLVDFVRMIRANKDRNWDAYLEEGDWETINHDYDREDEANTPYCYQLMGSIDALIELTGGTNPRIELTAKQWEGAPATVFDITRD